MTPDEAEKARYAARFPGWRRSTGAVCIRRVAGKQCLRGGLRRCVCEDYYHSPLDHARIWIAPGGEIVLTAEPYGVFSETFLPFLLACRALDLCVSVEADSPYYPGQTVMVRVVRNSPPPTAKAAEG